MDWSEKTIEGGKNRIEGSAVLLVGNAVVLGRRLVLFAPPSTVLGGVCVCVCVCVWVRVCLGVCHRSRVWTTAKGCILDACLGRMPGVWVRRPFLRLVCHGWCATAGVVRRLPLPVSADTADVRERWAAGVEGMGVSIVVVVAACACVVRRYPCEVSCRGGGRRHGVQRKVGQGMRGGSAWLLEYSPQCNSRVLLHSRGCAGVSKPDASVD